MTRKRNEFQPGQGYSKEDWDAVDSPELTDEEIASMRPAREVLPVELFEAVARARKAGRPRIESPKQAITLRLDLETVEKFKRTGGQWRSKMSEVLDRAKVG